MTAAAILLCSVDDLPPGSARGFAALGIFIVRHGAGRGTGRGAEVSGWRDACPHDGQSPLAWRRDAYLNRDATRIVCSAHGAQFEPDTGLCRLGPCLGQSLTRVPLVVTDLGEIRLAAEPAAAATPAPITPQETTR